MKVSDKSHSAENLEQCFMLAKRFVSSKNWGFDENKLEKSRIEKTLVFKKKQKSDIACWAWENLILRQKLFDLKNLKMPKTVKGGHFEIFLTYNLLQNTKKNEARNLWWHKKIAKKNHEAVITCTKNFGQGRDSNPRPSAWQTSKNPN